jgi:phenylalanine-4-hydroxylase
LFKRSVYSLFATEKEKRNTNKAMNTLIEKQKQVLQKEEMELINIFNSTIQFSNSENFFKKQEKNSDFETKMEILKTSSNGMDLYHKLLTIQNNIGDKYATKYLNNYLEYHNLTLNSFVQLNKN